MLSHEVSLAARAALGFFLASLLVLVPPLRLLFSTAAQSLLPNAAVLALFTAGTSLEQTICIAVQGLQGTLAAVLNTAMVYSFYGEREIEVYSFLSLAVVLETSFFVAVVCVLIADDNTKMFVVGNTAYFMMAFFNTATTESLTAMWLCIEYMSVMVVGELCMVLAYAVYFPGIRDVRAMQSVPRSFEAVVDSCAELIMEASSAIMGQGAGEAWSALARNRLVELSRKLAEARGIAADQHWAPAIVLRHLQLRGRVAAAVWSAHHEAAFAAAASAANTCALLSDLAVHTHAQARSMEAIAVRGALSAGVEQVAESAVALLRDFVRTSFQQACWREDWERGAEELLAPGGGDAKRRQLRRAARAALRKSSEAASRELMLLGMYGNGAEAERENDTSKGNFASARGDMAAFLFLMHALAADLLGAEGNAQETARRVAADMGWKNGEVASSMEHRPSGMDGEEEQEDREYLESSLWTPLLFPRSRQASVHFTEGPTSGNCLGWTANKLRHLQRRVVSTATAQISGARAALRQRGRIALKVTASFVPAFAGCIYFLGCDSTFVSTVAYVCTYGSQYSGGSLRRAVLRALGIALGVTVGATLESMQKGMLGLAGLEEGDDLHTALRCLMSTVATTGWVFVAFQMYFGGGQYAYVGFCGGFTATKFMLWDSLGGIDPTATVLYNMYACLLTTVVEVVVLPVDAVDILRSRFAASLAGDAAVLSALVTSGVEDSDKGADEAAAEKERESPITLQIASEALRYARRSGDHHRDTLPDLTELLKQAGTYEKYLTWRDGYLQWRQQKTKGARGELTTSAAQGCTTNRPDPDKQPAKTLQSRKVPLPQPASSSQLLTKLKTVPEPVPAQMTGSGDAGRDFAGLAVAFTPAEDTTSAEDVLEPIAGVQLPASHLSTAKPAGAAGEVFLSAVDPAFTDGVAKIEEMIVEGRTDALARQVSPGNPEEEDEGTRAPGTRGQGGAPAAELDPEAALECPRLAELLKQDAVTPDPGAEPTCEDEPPDASKLHRSPSMTIAPRKGTGHQLVSLAEVQTLLAEIASAQAPAESLYSQAAERLDSLHVDTRAWRLLGDALNIVHLRLQVLARLAERLRHGVCVAELLGGPGEEAAAGELVASFGMALAAARAAIVGSAAPSACDAATLEIRLQDSASKLVQALARRPPQQAAARCVGVTSEVLAGTAGATLAALLQDAAEVLARAVVLAAPGAEPMGMGNCLNPKKIASPPAGPKKAALDLPDLTLRLQEIGMYEKYLAWREGYMRWRGGGTAGAHGEITEDTTT